MGFRGIARALIILAPILAFTGCRVGIGPDGLVPTGTWAGSDAVVTVTDTAVHIDWACASGDIPQPLRVDNSGSFSLDGVYVRSAGPARAEQPALYAGRVDGQTMTLTVTLKTANETVGSFTLTYKAVSHLVKCV